MQKVVELTLGTDEQQISALKIAEEADVIVLALGESTDMTGKLQVERISAYHRFNLI